MIDKEKSFNNKKYSGIFSKISANTQIITRLGVCPFISAAGSMSICELRSQLFTYVMARYVAVRDGKSTIIVRCDDTDFQKTDINLFKKIMHMFLEILEMKIDLHPYNSESTVGYTLIQSQRQELYKKYLDHLIANKIAYFKGKKRIFFDIQKFTTQFNSFIRVNDVLHGEYHFQLEDIIKNKLDIGKKDFPLTRSDGSFLWHLCSPIDDYLMGVNFIVRGQDKISNLPYQEMVRIALNFPEKEYMHIPLLLAEEKSSKLNFSNTLDEFIKNGFLVKSIINYLCSSLAGEAGKIYDTLDDFSRKLSLTSIHKTNNRFDYNRLSSINRKILTNIDKASYYTELLKFSNLKKDFEFMEAIENIKQRELFIELKKDFTEIYTIIKSITNVVYDNLHNDELYFINEFAQELAVNLVKISENSSFNIYSHLRDLIKLEKNNPKICQAIRWMLIGKTHGVAINFILSYMEIKNIVIGNRLQNAKEKLNLLLLEPV